MVESKQVKVIFVDPGRQIYSTLSQQDKEGSLES